MASSDAKVLSRTLPVLEPKLIDERWEWASLAKLSPSIYADQVWTDHRVRRLQRMIGPRVESKLIRVWSDDSLVVCPLIVIHGLKKDDQRWFNSPRSMPTVVSGPPLDFATMSSVVADAIPSLDRVHGPAVDNEINDRPLFEMTDDSEQIALLHADLAKLNETEPHRMFALDAEIMAEVKQLPNWCNQFHEWVEMMNFLSRGWSMTADVFRRQGRVDGLSINVNKHGIDHPLSVLRRGAPVVLSSQR